MDLTSEYCQKRRGIEERSWALVSRLCLLTSRLPRLVGNHNEFHTTKSECADVRRELLELRVQLLNHRLAHQC